MKPLDVDRLLSRSLNRRNLLIGAGTLAGWTFASQFPRRVIASFRFPDYLFTLGVTSGDPLPNGVVLWTRLAPDPLNGGGMPPYGVPVQWQVAADENMRRVVRAGIALARPEWGHSVHVEVRGLQPDHQYWYQFRVGDQLSPIGRTRTAPAWGVPLSNFRFAIANCQHYEQGFYTAYQHMAQQDLNLVVHLGDYIYEGAPVAGRPRQHNSSEIITLEDYRNRYALYKTDPDLQAAHAAFPWLVTWDDHEVENNYANDISEVDTEPDQDPVVFLQRRAIAYQVYYEHMPLRRFSIPKGPDMQLYRRYTFGRLVEFNVLDTRQYRTDQPCGDGAKPRCEAVTDPNATITGAKQEQWLYGGLNRSQAQWNVLAQQVMVAQRDTTPGEGQTFSMDKWDGYLASRDRLMGFLQERQPSNPVVLTGDLHNNWVSDLKANFDDPTSATVGTEFVCTSISSGGDGADSNSTVEAYLPDNPHIKFFNNQRGYILCDLNQNLWQSDYWVVSAVTVPGGTLSIRASFVVENGQLGAQRV
jgi:alkaline phosphatase D